MPTTQFPQGFKRDRQASGHSWRDSQRLVNPAKETETLPRFVVEEKTEIVVARKGSELDGS
jgi:hypothetical protein